MKKVKYIALILVLTLGLIGGAYAAWTDSLQAKGTVATGNIDVRFTKVESNDPGETEDPNCPPDDRKHVGKTEAKIIDNGKKIEITITNAYPGYTSEVAYCVVNQGSVPVKLQSKIPSWNPELGLEVKNCGFWFWWPGWPGWPGCPGDSENGEPDEGNPNPLEIGSQLHQGEEFCGVIKHKVTDDAKQNSNYTYTIDYKFVLFNQYQAD